MPVYTRESPSPRYTELLTMYRTMHDHGDSNYGIAAQDMFSGISLPPQAIRIRNMIKELGAETTLDYGCGKAMLYNSSPLQLGDESYNSVKEFWGVKETMLFDPGYKPYSAFPTKKADLVISTDVLEHCPEQDVTWILKEIFSFASKGVYLNISSYPARKTLPNGENAHCTVRPQHWWQGALNYVGALHPHLRWQCWLDVVTNGQKEAILITQTH